ncbi:putative PpiC-type peptidyl-prolyl cis-trans isomerase [Nitrospina gracilis 3/211]|uniref:Periplasmic chaperone PpiD n=1 Tax=Nitrospina gracilis (strain 3/211) TaxID=1266370 RepID=M1YNN1_NITG3|nr:MULTISPECIES: SurA N-terminal domain-containing protein [Nitrospina]MCF8722016.1 peptidyl-prolyl cis-trans isomerase D [Nitrospina sp. Nb-3]CCQ92141.1 putative PpiC-type peptidyl-prolyl cis-trans isomerase [Nitrospina gracilis 3/211]
MLNLIRQHADSWMIKGILWLIVLAFVGTIFYSWGMGGPVQGRSGLLGTVNGKNITLAEYDRSFENLVSFYRDQFQSRFSEDMIEKMDLKNSALEALVQKKLLLMEAEKQGIQISDAELADRILTNTSFQKDNKFSRALYDRFLTFNRMTAQEFEANQRQFLLMEKVESFIKDNTQVSDVEIQEAWAKENRKIKIQYVAFSRDYFQSQITPTDEQLKQYFEAHKRDFEVPLQIKAQYVKLSPAQVIGDIKVYDEDIKDYYDANQATYLVKKRYKARHILVRTELNTLGGDTLSTDEKEKRLNESDAKAKAKAEDILKQIKEGGKTFEEMAKEHSDDKMSGAKGGDLGQFPKGTMVPEFEAALETMKPGAISGPVQTAFGFHLIKLEEVHPQRLKPLEEVKEEIVEKLKKMKATQRIRRIAKKIFQSAEKDQDLSRAAQKYEQTTKTTDFFSGKDHDIPEIGVVPEFFNTAFTLQDNAVSSPVNTFEASYLLKVIERKPPYVPDFEEVEAEVKEAFMESRHLEVTKAKWEKMAHELAKDGNLEALAEANTLVVEETPYFSQVDSIPGIGNIQSIKAKAFDTEPGKTTRGESPQTYYLIKVVDLQQADKPNKKEIQQTYQRLKQEKGNIVFRNWLENKKAEARILVDKTLL